MTRIKTILLLYFTTLTIVIATVGLGSIQTNVPWKAGHASVYTYPYVIIYGGTPDITTSSTTSQTIGSTSLWVWDSRNGSWYNPTIQVQGGAIILPQMYFKAIELPSQGQVMAIGSNTTNGSTTNIVQRLDTNSWSWSFPTTNFQSSARTVGYSITISNNSIFTYGGLSVDQNGFPQANAVQNTLTLIDANSFQLTPGSNGLGVTDHTTCYLKACNCLVTFGGTSTGIATDVVDTVTLYNLTNTVWNVQGIMTAAGSATPSARRLHTANCLDDYMLIYGGGTDQPADTDVWILNATSYPTLAWQRINMANATEGPNLRMGHSAVLDKPNNRIYIYGGWGVSATNDSNMYILDMTTWSWTRVPTTGLPSTVIPPINPNTNTTNTNSNTGVTPVTSKNNNTGAIVGGSVGGILFILAGIAALVFFLKRRKRMNGSLQSTDQMSENIATQNKESPFYYNPAGYYATNDTDEDEDDDEGNDRERDFYATTTATNTTNTTTTTAAVTPNTSNNRLSKAFSGNTMSSRPSFAGRRSEIGDYSDKVVTGILEALDPITNSGDRQSKILLALPMETIGQVPNEIISQKPNEFSIPAARHIVNNNAIHIDHYQQVATAVAALQQQQDPKSIKTANSSMLNHAGDSTNYYASGSNQGRNNGIIPVTHTTAEAEDDNWTFADSLSVNHHTNQQTSSTLPIQYILSNNNNNNSQSINNSVSANSAQTWDTKELSNKNRQQRIPLVHHQNYPSSTINMPIAETIESDPVTVNHQNTNNQLVDIYNTVSPLDALALLGQPQSSASSGPSSSNIISSGKGVTTISNNSGSIAAAASSDITTISDESNTTSNKYNALVPFISALPKRYKVDMSTAPIIGSTNNILYAVNTETNTPVAIKSFGRREAWERECRNLVKLKSSSVVEILEVLTIQDGTSHHSQEEEDDNIQYVIIMEKLDETLSKYIRHLNTNIDTTRKQHNRMIAKDILSCLSFCHNNNIAICDLKPSNIMHNQGQSWKLIDFEASRTIHEECVGVITPRYCPPEVARATTYGMEGANGVVATASVDLWSLGCVIYELEAKKPLFPTNMKDETILHFISHPSPSTPILNNGLRWNEQKELEIPQLDKTVPDLHTRQLIKTLLCRDPHKRGSAPQLLMDLYFSS